MGNNQIFTHNKRNKSSANYVNSTRYVDNVIIRQACQKSKKQNNVTIQDVLWKHAHKKLKIRKQSWRFKKNDDNNKKVKKRHVETRGNKQIK